MSGWRSRYDYEGMTNVEKYVGRKLHTQDNNWTMAKILFIVGAIYVGWLIINGDLNISGVKEFLQYLK